MGSVGQVDAVRRDPDDEQEKDTFDLLDEPLELRRRLSGWDAIRWAALAATETATREEEARLGIEMAAEAHKLLKKSLTPEALQRFGEICDENELGARVVLQTVELLLGAASGKDQSKPSGSSDGSSTTSTSSSSDLQLYTDKGLRLVPAEDWAKVHLAS